MRTRSLLGSAASIWILAFLTVGCGSSLNPVSTPSSVLVELPSILDFIAGGGTGSYGTMSEPCVMSSKVSETIKGVFIGEPLANPWKK